MVNAQEWLDQEYPNKQIVKKIDLSGLVPITEESELIISDFPNLEEIENEWYGKQITTVTKVTIINCSKLKIVNINWFENNKELNLRNVPNLIKLNCSNNQISNFDFASLNFGTLTDLSMINNNLSPQDLKCFTHLVNLEKLWIGGNRFFGSLEPLKNCFKLKELGIFDTDINSGLEYLPESLEAFFCESHDNENKVSILEKALAVYETEYKYDDNISNLRTWKLNNLDLIANVQKIAEYERSSLVLGIVSFEMQEKIINLRKENQQKWEAQIQISPK